MEQTIDDDAFVLVGKFLKEWSYVEIGLDRIISGALGLSNMQSLVFSKALTYRVKMKLIRTLSNALIKEEETHKEILRKIEEINYIRNIVVHNHFRLSKDKQSVEFLTISAVNKKTKLMVETYSSRQFLDYFETMNGLHKDFEKLRKELKQSISDDKLVEALSNTPSNFIATDDELAP